MLGPKVLMTSLEKARIRAGNMGLGKSGCEDSLSLRISSMEISSLRKIFISTPNSREVLDDGWQGEAVVVVDDEQHGGVNYANMQFADATK